MDQKHALYRFYGAGGTLLYIGITNSLPRRLGQHNDKKAWWHGVSDVKVEHYPNREAVLEAERRAIIAEKPLYNDKHNAEGIGKKARPRESPALDIDGMLAEMGVLLASEILSALPQHRVEEFKAEAFSRLSKDDPRAAEVIKDTVLILGPAASVAFEDVYAALCDMAEQIQSMVNALPEDLSTRLMDLAQGDLATKQLGIRHLPGLIVKHFTDHYLGRVS